MKQFYVHLAPSQFARAPTDTQTTRFRSLQDDVTWTLTNLISLTHVNLTRATPLTQLPCIDTPLVIMTLHRCYARFLSFIHSGR